MDNSSVYALSWFYQMKAGLNIKMKSLIKHLVLSLTFLFLFQACSLSKKSPVITEKEQEYQGLFSLDGKDADKQEKRESGTENQQWPKLKLAPDQNQLTTPTDHLAYDTPESTVYLAAGSTAVSADSHLRKALPHTGAAPAPEPIMIQPMAPVQAPMPSSITQARRQSLLDLADSSPRKPMDLPKREAERDQREEEEAKEAAAESLNELKQGVKTIEEIEESAEAQRYLKATRQRGGSKAKLKLSLEVDDLIDDERQQEEQTKPSKPSERLDQQDDLKNQREAPLLAPAEEIAIDQDQINGLDDDFGVQFKEAEAQHIIHANTKDAIALQALLSSQKPTEFWPRKGYFQNRYLGGDPGYLQLKNSLPVALRQYLDLKEAKLNIQPLDIPKNQALGLSVSLSRNDFTGPQPVLMQIALQGSDRFGWRRPPINWMVVMSPTLIGHYFLSDHTLSHLFESILNMLEPMDQVGFMVGDIIHAPMNLDELREFIVHSQEQLKNQSFVLSSANTWLDRLDQAGKMLEKTANHPHRVPGTQGLLLVLDGMADREIEGIKAKVHELNTKGIVSSVFVESSQPSSTAFWEIAEQGHGNVYLFNEMSSLAGKLEEELKQNAKVIARLLRLNIKTAKNVSVTRILGTDLLAKEEVKRVKEKEVAMDKALSQVYGVQADRGADDDGLQVVIPYFYGNDQHVISVLLWAEQAGEVAEVELKYKDLISLNNAQMATTVSLSQQKQNQISPLNEEVISNALQILDAELLEQLAVSIQQGNSYQASNLINQLSNTVLRQQLLRILKQSIPLTEQHLLFELMSKSKKGLTQMPINQPSSFMTD